MVIGLRDQQGIRVSAAAGHVGPELIGATFGVDGSVAGFVVRSKRSQRLSDVASHLHYELASYVDARAGLVVPLAFRGRVLGVLYALDRSEGGPEFGADDERLLEAFAASAATAVATAQQFAAHGLRRSLEASEQERRRWARELHDQTLQDLGALRVSLSTARRIDDPELLRDAVDDAVDRLASGIDELRTIITDLRPAALDELGVRPALEALAERTQATSGIEVRLRYDAAPDAGRHAPALESAIYRLVQEAITNAVKHAAAGRIDVSVVEHDENVEIRVSDDGAGFDPDDTDVGFGLIGMRERVALLNGSLAIDSEHGAGTTVRAVVPAAAIDQGSRVAAG
jgi:signal transduction histidine kinase